MDRNPNIIVGNAKGPWVSRLTSKSIRMALPSLEEIPEVCLITRQES